MLFTSRRHTDGLTEREFTIGGVSGILWTPPQGPAPLILLGHPGGIERMRPRLRARAHRSAFDGFASVAIELPGAGERERLPAVDAARTDLRASLQRAEPVSADVIDRLITPLVDAAVPEWQSVLDELTMQPGIGYHVGVSGGPIAIALRLAAIDPRITAAGLFAGSYAPAATFSDARLVTIPVHMLLQWDDEGNDRQLALDLFDALGSTEKTLQANLGGHTGVPAFAGEDAARFFARHLRPSTVEQPLGDRSSAGPPPLTR